MEKFKTCLDTEELLKESERIMSLYIVHGSVMQINIEWPLKQEVMDRIRDADVDVNVFSKCQEHVFKVMFQDTFLKWKQTQEFTRTTRLRSHESRESRASQSSRKSLISLFGSRDVSMKSSAQTMEEGSSNSAQLEMSIIPEEVGGI